MPRFKRQGKAKLFFATAVASPAAPTTAEITAATPLLADFREASGFTSEQAFIDQPDYVTDFVPQITGRTTSGSPSIRFYDQDAATNAIRTALAEGATGFILRMPYGQVTGRRMETWPAQVGALNDSDWGSDADSAMFDVAVAVTAKPTKTAVVP